MTTTQLSTGVVRILAVGHRFPRGSHIPEESTGNRA